MKKSIVVLAILVGVLCLGFLFHQHQTSVWEQLYMEAFQAFDRASEESLSQGEVFEPRLLEFERTVDRLARLAQPLGLPSVRSKYTRKVNDLYECKAVMQSYRGAFQTGLSTLSQVGALDSNCERTGNTRGSE